MAEIFNFLTFGKERKKKKEENELEKFTNLQLVSVNIQFGCRNNIDYNFE